ncbi:MAG: hypothetical protein AAF627_19440 [Myxococcota bacterium]
MRWGSYITVEDAIRTIHFWRREFVFVTFPSNPKVYAFVRGDGLVFIDYKDDERQYTISSGSFRRKLRDGAAALEWLDSLRPESIGPAATRVIARRRHDVDMARAFEADRITAEEYSAHASAPRDPEQDPLPEAC